MKENWLGVCTISLEKWAGSIVEGGLSRSGCFDILNTFLSEGLAD